MDTEKRSTDIQRLTKPLRRKDSEIVQNPYSFGGGLRNGGLSKEALELLAPIMAFDYMGSAEFEFGALPKALGKMAEAGKLTVFTIDVKTGENPHCWKEEAQGVCEDKVFVLCPEGWEKEVTKRIKKFAHGEDTGYSGTRERVGLESSIRIKAKGERDPDYLGWIEINQGYMFFVDEDMWRQTAVVFGIDC